MDIMVYLKEKYKIHFSTYFKNKYEKKNLL